MEIHNQIFKFARQDTAPWLKALAAPFAAGLAKNAYPLRFSIVNVDHGAVTLEATTVSYAPDHRYADQLAIIEALQPRKKTFQTQPFGVVQIVPTGLRCEFGGYAGDACPATNLLAAAADFLVTHPNAVNASDLNEMADNVLYVEGKSLDDFLLGHLALLPVLSNRVGTIVDRKGINSIDYVINTLNAARAVKGIDCRFYAVLHEDLGARIEWSQAGCAIGTISNPEAILKATEYLLANGIEAVGGVSVIDGVTKEMFSKHLHGKIPNPSGGVEAIITHLISKIFKIPAAHAPLPYYRDVKEIATTNPRASAEFISVPHYFSVLKGLAKAPRLVPISNLENHSAHLVSLNNIGAIIIPGSCLGGIPALAAEYSNIPLIAVKENQTVLHVTNQLMKMANVIEVNSYLEAAGVILALRQGISLESLSRPLSWATRIDAPERIDAAMVVRSRL